MTGGIALGVKPPVFGGKTIFAIGDSITALGYSDQGAMTYNQVLNTSYVMWTVLLSKGRLVHAGVSGTSGYTSAQILATHLPVALAAQPRKCIVLAGVNDAQSGVALSTTIANLTSIYGQLAAAGIEPILCTITPKNAATSANNALITQINAWINRYGQRVGYKVVDLHGAVTNTDGTWLPGYTADGLHPTAVGAKVMGQTIADAIAPAPSAGGVLRPWLADWNDDPGYALTANLLNLVDTNADGLPDGWTLPSGSPTYANPTNANIVGKYMSLTRAATNVTMTYGSNFVVSAGDRIYFAARVGSTVEANGGAVYFKMINTGATQTFWMLNGWTTDIPDGSVLAIEFTVPAGLASYSLLPQVSVFTAAGAQIRIGQMTVLNLTANGLL